MKVLLVNGSPKANGNTARALAEVAEQLKAEGIDTEVFQLGAKPIRDCIGCGQCGKLGGRCTFDDDVVNELIAAAEQADGFVFGSPVYYAHPSGRILSALDRAFYAGSTAFTHKPGAAVAVARRAGLGYWQNLDVTTYAGWEDFLARNDLSPADERLHLLTKKARRTYAQSTYRDGDFLVFGSESSGIPEPLLAAASERCERIPMLRDCDSLDNADAWEAHEESLGHTEDGHEAILQQDICGNFVNPDDYRISALNLSNSAAIVLYEALRQAGFPGM